MSTPVQHSRRAGFTMIEMLVVIAIIAMLAGLVLAGVFRFMVKGPEMQTQNDFQQLSTALTAFKQDKQISIYPPGKIRLCSNRSTYASSPTPAALGGPALDADSVRYLAQIWPKLGGPGGNWVNIDWAGSGTPTDVILEGDQCLVFFLGGIQGTKGFSPDATDPSNMDSVKPGSVVPEKNKKRYFEFDPARLFIRPGRAVFPSYADAFSYTQPDVKKQPIIYFAAPYKATITMDYSGQGGNAAFSIAPFMQSASKFFNEKTFQLVSAGPDRVFGQGGLWSPALGEQYDRTSAAGVSGKGGNDDLSNLAAYAMGAGQ